MDFVNKEGLLFYLSGKDLSADFAIGEKCPTFAKDVSVHVDNSGNSYLKCEDRQKLAWKASGNIFAKRGTLSFFWKSRYEIGNTEFPLFRVGFSDHTSWDQSWLRIDYSGYGYDAMITDRNLARARISYRTDKKPNMDQWFHFALSWDQLYGIRFYLNGNFVAEEIRPGVYDTGLDQFGPHGRSVSNWSVCNDYNFIRGGDIREIVVYDRMLPDSAIKDLSELRAPSDLSSAIIPVVDSIDNWESENGLDCVLPTLPDYASVRKVEIHDVYDIRRWYWKACDGIRETTWPGVYNRSRLKGRNDYYQLPDWDCYSLSGKEITFFVPDEDFNWIEISGSAFGVAEYIDATGSVDTSHLFTRPNGKERTVHNITTHHGGKIKFINEQIEEPIGDFSLFNVKAGESPEGLKRISYYLSTSEDFTPVEKNLYDFILGRFPSDERCMLIARNNKSEVKDVSIGSVPFYQIAISYEYDDSIGLDGIEIEFSDIREYDVSIQIKDPLWYYRNLVQLSFHKISSSKVLWLDTRDRILPKDRCLFITIASGRYGLRLCDLLGWKFTLVYKSKEIAKIEHCIDRFTQVRDVYGHLVEEAPKGSVYGMYRRFIGDIEDLMRVNPNHVPGKYYLYEKSLLDHGCTKFPGFRKEVKNTEDYYRPDMDLGTVPVGIPEWAWWQVYYLKQYKYVVNWYIDNRQIFNGEFGGGLSDDGDFTSDFVGLALMGCNPEKIITSIERLNDAFYNQGMFTNGLCSIQADELHSSEEGITCLAQCCAVDFGNPKYIERAMENARAGYWITGINRAGHRHFRSSYYSGSKIAKELPWSVQNAFSGIALSPAWYVARFNRNEKVMRLLEELADGILAHKDSETGYFEASIEYETDLPSVSYTEGAYTSASLQGKDRGNLFTLWPAYRLIGDKKYYDSLNNKFKSVDVCYVSECNTYNENNAKFLDKKAIADQYRERCYHAAVREYYNTLGSPWIDRVELRYQEIQYDRLGGIGYERRYVAFPRNMLSWKFKNNGDDESIAILSPIATDDRIKMIIANISRHDVYADILGAEMSPGLWHYRLGVDEKDCDSIEYCIQEGKKEWYRMEAISLIFPAEKTCVLEMNLLEENKSRERYCDLGISKDDLRLWDHGLNVKVHSIGYLSSEPTEIVLRNKEGMVVLSCDIPALEAPTDLYPRTWEAIFNTWQIDDLTGYSVEIDPMNNLKEITKYNNKVVIDEALMTFMKKNLYYTRRTPVF